MDGEQTTLKTEGAKSMRADKITVGSIEKTRCIVHGNWRLTGLSSTADAP